MKKIIYDVEKLKLFSYAEVANEHPEWTTAKQKEVAYSEKRLNDLKRRKTIQYCLDRFIRDVGNVDLIDVQFEKRRFEWMIDNLPESLIQNVHEYINDEPISDIFINDWSINKILKTISPKRATFINAVSYMIRWKEQGYPNPELYFFTNRISDVDEENRTICE